LYLVLKESHHEIFERLQSIISQCNATIQPLTQSFIIISDNYCLLHYKVITVVSLPCRMRANRLPSEQCAIDPIPTHVDTTVPTFRQKLVSQLLIIHYLLANINIVQSFLYNAITLSCQHWVISANFKFIGDASVTYIAARFHENLAIIAHNGEPTMAHSYYV